MRLWSKQALLVYKVSASSLATTTTAHHRKAPRKKTSDVLTLAAWELKPPMLPAMAEPTKFLAILHSTILLTVVLRTDETVFADKIASTCIT